MNNPSYIRYEQRERHAIVDRMIRDSHEVLAIPSVAQLLGVRAMQLSATLDTLTVPNIHHGIIYSRVTSEHAVDIIALHANERALRRFSSCAWNSAQEQHLREVGIPHVEQLIALQARHYSQDKHSAVPTFDDHPTAVAQVFSAKLPIETTLGMLYLRGRPLVVAHADNPTWHHPAFTLHELTHVQQVQADPLIGPYHTPASAYAQEESEGYNVAAQIIRGQQLASTNSIRLDAAIEQELLRLDEYAN